MQTPTVETENARGTTEAGMGTSDYSQAESKPTGAKVDFPVPEGFTIPESARENDGEFDVVCTMRLEGDKLCITKLGDTPMPGYDDHDESKEQAKPTYDNMAASMAADAPPPQTAGY
jgi:hypothetical protein